MYGGWRGWGGEGFLKLGELFCFTGLNLPVRRGTGSFASFLLLVSQVSTCHLQIIAQFFSCSLFHDFSLNVFRF